MTSSKNKLIKIIEKSYIRLNVLLDYFNENHEKIFKLILHDDIRIVKIYCEIIFELLSNISNLNFDMDFIDENNSLDNGSIKIEQMEKAKKLIDFILFLFPKIPSRKLSNINPLLNVNNKLI